MNSDDRLDRDELQMLLGTRNERILQLDRCVAQQKEDWGPGASEWRRLIIHRREVAEWVVDQVTDDAGRLFKRQVDPSLGGEDFIPCTFIFAANNRKYQIALVSTQYEITEVDPN